MESEVDAETWEELDGPGMRFDDRVPLHRIVGMQGFDANVVGRREVYRLLDWTRGKARRRYDLSLVFDGAQRGLDAILSDYDGSALCVGRGTVGVGVDDPLSMTFARRFDSGGRDASAFVLSARKRVPLPVETDRAPTRSFGPFSAEQQLYAAGAGEAEAEVQTLYGFRLLWPAGESAIQERCFALHAHTVEDARALLSDHFRREYADVDPHSVVVEVDDMGLETIVSDFSLFTASRTSQLGEFAFIEAFRLGPILE